MRSPRRSRGSPSCDSWSPLKETTMRSLARRCSARRVVGWLVPGIALVSLLAACAPAQAPPAAPAQSARPEAAGQSAAPAGQPAAPASAPSSGSAEWVVALAEEAATLDPLYGQSTAGSTLAQSHIYDTLVGYEGTNLKQVPMLAESWK